MQGLDIRRTLVETAVNQALRRILDDPERGVRGLIDLGYSASRGAAQKHFLGDMVAAMASGESAYYELIGNAMRCVAADRLKTFGLNMGYNGFVSGIRTIRRLGKNEQVHVPWFLFFDGRGAQTEPWLAQTERAIDQGEKLGISTFLMNGGSDQAQALLDMARRHWKDALVLLLEPAAVNEALVSELADLSHVMVCLNGAGEDYLRAAALLKENRCLYSAYRRFGEIPTDDQTDRMAGEAANSGALFLLLCTQAREVQRALHRYALANRTRQTIPVMVMDMVGDFMAIDEMVSGSAATAYFDPRGCLCNPFGDRLSDASLEDTPLYDLLKLL